MIRFLRLVLSIRVIWTFCSKFNTVNNGDGLGEAKEMHFNKGGASIISLKYKKGMCNLLF